MRKNILIIGLAGILGTLIPLSSCAPDYETEFNVLTLSVPSDSQAPVVFPLSGGEHEIVVETNVALENWTVSSNAEWCKLKKKQVKLRFLLVRMRTINNVWQRLKLLMDIRAIP